MSFACSVYSLSIKRKNFIDEKEKKYQNGTVSTNPETELASARGTQPRQPQIYLHLDVLGALTYILCFHFDIIMPIII